MKLENWSVVSKSPYSPPEAGISFHGNVFGHPRFSDGQEITTSKIVSFDGEKFFSRSGSEYILGTVDEEYEKIFPNAFARLIKNWRS